MNPLTIAGIMAAAGLGKSLLIDKPREDRDRKLAAETQRYSPWTGLRAGQIREADPIGTTVGFGMTGASFGQSMNQFDKQNALADAQINESNASAKFYDQGGPWSIRNRYNPSPLGLDYQNGLTDYDWRKNLNG